MFVLWFQNKIAVNESRVSFFFSWTELLRSVESYNERKGPILDATWTVEGKGLKNYFFTLDAQFLGNISL